MNEVSPRNPGVHSGSISINEENTAEVQTAAKVKRGRGPTVARWMLGIDHGTAGIEILGEKYISPDTALRAVETKGIDNAKYLVREIVAETKVTARLV